MDIYLEEEEEEFFMGYDCEIYNWEDIINKQVFLIKSNDDDEELPF